MEIARSRTAVEASRTSMAVTEIIVIASAVTAPMLMKTRQNVRGLVYSGTCREQTSNGSAGGNESDRGLKGYMIDGVIVGSTAESVCGRSLHANLTDRSARMPAMMIAGDWKHEIHTQ